MQKMTTSMKQILLEDSEIGAGHAMIKVSLNWSDVDLTMKCWR